MSKCSHKEVIFHGAMNLNDRGKIIGSLDIWRCQECKELFSDYKRFGEVTLQPNLGFQEAGKGAKWGVLICSRRDGVEWKMMPFKPGHKVHHGCGSSEARNLKVREDFSLDSKGDRGDQVEHKILLVEDYVNEAIEVGYDDLASSKI